MSGIQNRKRRLVRNGPRAAVLLTFGLACIGMAAVVVVAASRDGEPVAGILCGAFLLGSGIAGCLYARTGVIVDDDGLTIRRIVGSRHIDWNDVVSFGLKSRRSRFSEQLERPGVTLRSGEVLWIQGIEPPGRPLGISSKPIRFPQLEQLEEVRRGRRRTR